MSATLEASPIKLTFGDFSADDSRYYEGIAGNVPGNVIRVHEKAFVIGGRTAARGQDAF